MNKSPKKSNRYLIVQFDKTIHFLFSSCLEELSTLMKELQTPTLILLSSLCSLCFRLTFLFNWKYLIAFLLKILFLDIFRGFRLHWNHGYQIMCQSKEIFKVWENETILLLSSLIHSVYFMIILRNMIRVELLNPM